LARQAPQRSGCSRRFGNKKKQPAKTKVNKGFDGFNSYVLYSYPEAAATPASKVGFYATNSLSCFFSAKAVAVGLCPTPQFLFGVQKGTEKDNARLRRFFCFFTIPIHPFRSASNTNSNLKTIYKIFKLELHPKHYFQIIH